MNNLFQIDLNVVLDDVIKVLVPTLLGGGVYLLRQMVGKAKFTKVVTSVESKSKLAKLAVSYAQQAYQQLDGADKFSKAEKYLVQVAQRHGLKMSDADIKTHIEAAVLDLKQEVAKDLPQAIQSAVTPIQPVVDNVTEATK